MGVLLRDRVKGLGIRFEGVTCSITVITPRYRVSVSERKNIGSTSRDVDHPHLQNPILTTPKGNSGGHTPGRRPDHHNLNTKP